MRQKRFTFFFLLTCFIVLFIILLMQFAELRFVGTIAILQPKGEIGLIQRNLLLLIQGLMLLIVIPVYFLAFYFAWKYRAESLRATYTPDWDDHPIAEGIWWGFPFVLVLIISVLTWIRTEQLDPFKPVRPGEKQFKIQVVALQWKWLFIYPEQDMATVNYVRFPVNTPLNFEITADAPMNSLWIPELGGQIYAMPGMRTELHLIADVVGKFRGASANISGTGFAGMHFIAQATSQEDFDQWVQQAKQSSNNLDLALYKQLAKPSENDPVTVFSLGERNLFDRILMKYMAPGYEI